MARVALQVVCKRCGARFDTAVRTDTESFRKGSFIANYHRCAECGTRETYQKADYLVVDARTGAPVEVGRAGAGGSGSTAAQAPRAQELERG